MASKKMILCMAVLLQSCLTMQPQTRVEAERNRNNVWCQEYVLRDGKWQKNGEPFVAPDTMKLYKVWRMR